jgi:hypothetical protein
MSAGASLEVSCCLPISIFFFFLAVKIEGHPWLKYFTRGVLQSLIKIYFIYLFFLLGAPTSRSPMCVSTSRTRRHSQFINLRCSEASSPPTDCRGFAFWRQFRVGRSKVPVGHPLTLPIPTLIEQKLD